jgi:hypothetical protein
LEIAVFWVAAKCSLVEVYRCFEGLAASIIALKMEAISTSEVSVNFYLIT